MNRLIEAIKAQIIESMNNPPMRDKSSNSHMMIAVNGSLIFTNFEVFLRSHGYVKHKNGSQKLKCAT